MILILFLITLAIGLLAQWHVKRTYARHSRTPVQSGHTGAEAAQEILRQAASPTSASSSMRNCWAMGFIQAGSERAAVSQVLTAAGWTYVAAFISSLMYFLWHLLPLLTGRQRN